MANELIPTRNVRRPERRDVKIITTDVCVLGAGISGVTAALESTRLGRKVVIVDGAPAIGGQAIGSIIGTLRHLVGGDVFYLDVLRQEHEPFDEATSDIPALRGVMELHGDAWQAQLAGDPDPTTDVIEFEDSGETHVPFGVRLAQALYHGTDHRSQICTALSYLGIDPPAIEAWDFARLDGRMYTVETP